MICSPGFSYSSAVLTFVNLDVNRVEQFPSIAPARSTPEVWIRSFRSLNDLVRACSEAVEAYHRSRPILSDEQVSKSGFERISPSQLVQVCLASSYLIDFQPHQTPLRHGFSVLQKGSPPTSPLLPHNQTSPESKQQQKYALDELSCIGPFSSLCPSANNGVELKNLQLYHQVHLSSEWRP